MNLPGVHFNDLRLAGEVKGKRPLPVQDAQGFERGVEQENVFHGWPGSVLSTVAPQAPFSNTPIVSNPPAKGNAGRNFQADLLDFGADSSCIETTLARGEY